jgi:hypothetical protein
MEVLPGENHTLIRRHWKRLLAELLAAAPKLALPKAAGRAEAEAEAGGAQRKVVAVGGAAVALDELGPVVVHEDGTVSRIGNWKQMSAHEQESTKRIVGKRNQQRMAKLEAEGHPSN